MAQLEFPSSKLRQRCSWLELSSRVRGSWQFEYRSGQTYVVKTVPLPNARQHVLTSRVLGVVLKTDVPCSCDTLKTLYAEWSIQFNLFHSNHLMVHKVLYQYVQICTIYMVHMNCDIDYGGQTFSYISDIKMHYLDRTL